MSLGVIYAFKDRGFDRGIKIGRDANPPHRFRIAQCYTPRGIDLVATWSIECDFRDLAEAERIARAGLPTVANPNGGAEWCDLDAAEAVNRVSANLRLHPDAQAGNPSINTTYDDFRDPKTLRGTEKHRQILWLYRENRTNILKVQRTASWKVPQEPVKTYSLLGFRPIAAFNAPRTVPLSTGNALVHKAWEQLVSHYGGGVKHLHVGWLEPEAAAAAVIRDIEACGLSQITDFSRCPPDVRPGY